MNRHLILVISFAVLATVTCHPRHDAHNSASFVEDADSTPNPDSCVLCQALVTVLQEEMSKNKSVNVIASGVQAICNTLHIEDNVVCAGIVSEYKDVFLYVLAHIVFTPAQLCNVFISSCGEPFDVGNEWDIQLPPTPKPPVDTLTLPPSTAPRLRVLQITDLHWDPHYVEGSEASCGEPLCCRNLTSGTLKQRAGHWGTAANCDSPNRTLIAMLEHFATISDQFDYIVWTGDLPPHNVWNQSKSDQLFVIKTLADMIKQYLPGKPVYPALGNHEGAPANIFPPRTWTDAGFIPSQFRIDWLYDSLELNWETWLQTADLNYVKRFASYAVQVMKGLRLISINTNACNGGNFWLYLNETDPDGELAWLVNQLQQAEDNQDKVHIIGHIPTGQSDCLKWWSWNYYKIVNRYENTIRAQFFGHTHTDSFQMFYENADYTGRATNVAFVAPSVTTFSFKNPAYRIYQVDGQRQNSTWSVLDHCTYYVNLDDANKHVDQAPTWLLEYCARAAFLLPSAFPADWNNLHKRMMSPDFSQLLTTYADFYQVLAPWKCNAACRDKLLCEIRTGRSSDVNLCADIYHLPTPTSTKSTSGPSSPKSSTGTLSTRMTTATAASANSISDRGFSGTTTKQQSANGTGASNLAFGLPIIVLLQILFCVTVL